MSNNLIEKLKEKKKVMKLSIAALAGAMTVCGGAALYSVSAMKPEGDIEVSTAAQAKEGDTEVSTAAQVKEGDAEVSAAAQSKYDVVEKRYQQACDVISKNPGGSKESIVDELFGVLRKTGDISDEDLASIHTYAKDRRDQDVMKYISMMRVVKFCEDHQGKCDLESGTIDLSIDGGGYLPADVVNNLADILKGDNVFLKFIMTGRKIGDAGARTLSDALRYCHIRSAGARALSEALKGNETLISLSLVGNDTGDEGARALSEALKVNTTLTRLNLRWNKIRDAGVSALSDTLKKNTTLTSLNLSDNGIRVEGASELSEALKINTTLTSLNLSDNGIRVEGASELSEALKTNTTLTSLNLEWNGIGAAGWEALREALQANTALTKIY